jgi:hypothetical protein
MDLLLPLIGAVVVLATLVDVYLTVLQGGSVALLSNHLNRAVWVTFRWTSGYVPRRDSFLTYAGPTIIFATVGMWVVLLLAGFALIYWPALGEGIAAPDGPTPTGFATALYVSGVSLSTLGTGDLVAQDDWHRLLMASEAIVGFSVVTASLTYLLGVYNAIMRNNASAAWMHHATGDRGDAVQLICHLGPGGDFNGARGTLSTMSHDLVEIVESHHTYVVLRFFRFTNPDLSLPRVALLTLDTTSLIATALDQDAYRTLRGSAAVVQLRKGGRQLVTELAPNFIPSGMPAEEARHLDEPAWREHYRKALLALRDEGIRTVADPAAGEERYVALRREWMPLVAAFTHYLAYDWQEVAPAQPETRPG